MPSLQSLGYSIATLVILFVSGGATCARRNPVLPFPPPPPVNLGENPTLEQVTQAVNRTASITQLSTNSAKVQVVSEPGLPKLNATMNLTRDRNFRLRANIPLLLGAGLDMGSNDELFWFELPEGVTKTLYFARHDQYQQQLRRAILPVDPTFLIDALGLVQIDPRTVVAGPIRRTDGKLEISTALPTPAGAYRRVFIIEPQAFYVTDQIVYDPSGALVAQSAATNHVYYPAQNSVLPHQVNINLIPSSGPALTLKIDVSSYTVNQLLSGDPNLFVIPSGASRVIDLVNAAGNATASLPGGTVAPPSFSTNQSGGSAARPVGATVSPNLAGQSIPGQSIPGQPSAYTADATLANPIRGLR